MAEKNTDSLMPPKVWTLVHFLARFRTKLGRRAEADTQEVERQSHWQIGGETRPLRPRQDRRGAPGGGRDRRAGRRPERRNDHSEGRRSFQGNFSDGQDRGGDPRRGGGPRDNNRRPPQFEPTVKIDLYPQDDAFDALVRRLRASARTYELFDIAKLLLEKPERYMVVVAPKYPDKNDTKETIPLFYSVPGHLPFNSEGDAVNFVLSHHLDLFFEVEYVEVEPPSGNFQVVNRCGISGELLGPPNYHRYQQFLQKHYSSKISGMSFEKFQSKIESVKEQEAIDAWLESMKKSARYILKEQKEGDPEVFETFEAARQFLLMHRRAELVGSGDNVRFAGRDIERLPCGDIRRSVESYIEQQKHFPLDTANNIRGRLRRHKFAVYKKGAKGVSYVCAVKRQFRDSTTSFKDSIRGLIEFIEEHPNTPASKLPKLYIGIDTEKQLPEALHMPEKPESGPADASLEASIPETAASKTPEPSSLEPEKATSTDAQPKSDLSAEEQAALRQLMLDLRWLITEGYVTEYGDGRLFAPPPLPESKKETATEPSSESPLPLALRRLNACGRKL